MTELKLTALDFLFFVTSDISVLILCTKHSIIKTSGTNICTIISSSVRLLNAHVNSLLLHKRQHEDKLPGERILQGNLENLVLHFRLISQRDLSLSSVYCSYHDPASCGCMDMQRNVTELMHVVIKKEQHPNKKKECM